MNKEIEKAYKKMFKAFDIAFKLVKRKNNKNK